MSKAGETFQNLSQGMNGGMFPAYISDYQYSKGINITCRGGVIRTRPPFNEIILSSTDAAVLHNVQYGKFQGMFKYEYEDSDYIAFAFSGSVYLLNPVTHVITDLTAIPGIVSATAHRLYFCQVENYMVVQDGTGPALIALNTAAAFAVAPQVPTGTIMAYGQGRLFIKTGVRSFIAGDINLPNTPTDVLEFTETDYLAGGGAFFCPTGLGAITGMEFVQQFGTATGLGPLMVFCKQGICSFDVSNPRLQWQDLSIMRIEAGGNGNVSHMGIVKLNDDLIFRTWGGIEDFAMVVGEQQQRQRITNLNMEVQPFLDNEDSSMLPFVSACKFQDRVLYTIQGEKVTALNSNGRGGYDEIEDYRFQGLVSLDFSPMNGIATMGATVRPAYDGVWTGPFPMGIASGIFNYTERCFLFGKDDDGVNHLFEIGDYPGNDNGTVPINCRLYTRMTPFVVFTGNRPSQIPHSLKTLAESWIWLTEIRDRVSFQLYSRPDRCFDFHKLSEFCMNAPLASVTGIVGNVQCSAKTKWPELSAQGCQQINGRPSNVGFEFEFCIEWDGQVEISRMMFEAESSSEYPEIPCQCTGEVLIGSVRSDYDYSIYAQGVVGDGFVAFGDTESVGGGGTYPNPTPGPTPPTPAPPTPGQPPGTIPPIVSGSGTAGDPYQFSSSPGDIYDIYYAACGAGAGGRWNVWVAYMGSSAMMPYSAAILSSLLLSGTGTSIDPYITTGVGLGLHCDVTRALGGGAQPGSWIFPSGYANPVQIPHYP